MPGLTNLFVEKTMKKISNHPEKFKGVMACDLFLSYMKNSTTLSPKDCFIINLSSSDHRGSHFICIFLDTSTSAEYFDSFGIESFDKNINKAMNYHGIKITHFRQRIQDISSDFCGLFCIGYLLWRQSGLSKTKFSSLFHTEKHFINNKIISELIQLFIANNKNAKKQDKSSTKCQGINSVQACSY